MFKSSERYKFSTKAGDLFPVNYEVDVSVSLNKKVLFFISGLDRLNNKDSVIRSIDDWIEHLEQIIKHLKELIGGGNA